MFLVASNRSTIRDRIVDNIPAGFAFTLKSVDRSLTQLTKAKSSVYLYDEELRQAGILLTSVGYDIPGNKITVGVDSSPKAAEAILSDIGAAVEVQLRQPAVLDVCDGVATCPPGKGVLKISGNDGYCTSGFMAKETNPTTRLVLVTTGHCWQFAQNNGNTTWKHNGVVVADSVDRVWSATGSRPYPVIPSDVGIMDIRDGFVPDTKNKLLTNNAGDVGLVNDWADSLLDHPTGTPVCRIGAGSAATQGFTAKKCGTITAWAVDNLSCKSAGEGPPCAMVTQTMEVSFDSTGGDSGGAIWKGPSGETSPYKAMGMHVHSDPDGQAGAHGWYTPISNAVDALLDRKGITIHICLNANC